METKTFELPDQKISDKKKTRQWHIMHANKMMNYLYGNFQTNRISKIRENENLYLATKVERKSVTEPDGYSLGLDYEVYPLIEGIIDDIIGKYLSRPLKRKSYSINKDAVNSKLDMKMDFIIEEIFREVNKDLNEKAGLELQTQNPQLEIPNDIEEFMSKDYKTNAEEISDDLITQFLDVNGYKDRIKMLLTDYLYGENCNVIFDEKDGHPELIRIRYDECYFGIDPEKEVQDDHDFFAFSKKYTESEIYNKYNLNRFDKQKVKMAFHNMSKGTILDADYNFSNIYENDFQNSKSGITYKNWMINSENINYLRAIKFLWKSNRQIRALVFKNKDTGREEYKLLDQDYKERRRDIGKIETIDLETLHYVEMLGPEIVLGYGELEHRNSKIDNPKSANLPTLSLVGKSFLKATDIRSVASKLKVLQEFASDILFQIRYIINNLGDKVAVYDAAQVPKQFLSSYGSEGAINRVFYHMKKHKALIINSADKNHKNTFNQFTSLDLSNRGALQDLTNGLILVEDLARKFVGLTPEAQGDVGQYQTATSINRSIIASNSRIEVYFEPFDNFMSKLLQKYIEKAKVVYPTGKVFSINFGDMQSKFLTIHKDFHDTDLGIYIGDTAKDLRDKSIIDQGAQMALSNAQDIGLIKNLISVLQKDSASESNAVLDRTIKALEKQKEQELEMVKSQQEQQQANEMDLRDRDDVNKQKDRDSNENIAKIYADNKTLSENIRNEGENKRKLAELSVKVDEINSKVNEKKEKS